MRSFNTKTIETIPWAVTSPSLLNFPIKYDYMAEKRPEANVIASFESCTEVGVKSPGNALKLLAFLIFLVLF